PGNANTPTTVVCSPEAPMMVDATNKKIKFGAYETERNELDFAQTLTPGRCSLEAQIMDWADDITYAVHDLEDFYRLGKITLDRLGKSPNELKSFLEGMFSRLGASIPDSDQRQYEDTAARVFMFCPVSDRYTGTRTQRAALRGFASSIIHEAVCGS